MDSVVVDGRNTMDTTVDSSMVDSGDSSHSGVDSGDHRVGGHNTSMVAVDSSMVAIDLSDGVGLGISISISLTLAIVSMDSIDSMVGHLGVASNSGVDSRDTSVDSSHSGDSVMDSTVDSSMVDSGDSGHCGVDSGDGMVDSWDSSHGGVDSRDHSPDSRDSSHGGVDSRDHRVGGHYTSMVAIDSSAIDVGISISISITLAISVSMDAMDAGTINSMDTAVDSSRVGASIGGMGSHRDSIPVTNGTNTRDHVMAIVHSSDDAAMGEPMVDLSDGVGISISISIG